MPELLCYFYVNTPVDKDQAFIHCNCVISSRLSGVYLFVIFVMVFVEMITGESYG